MAGLVLAGGQSSRFGSEKAVAPFRGRPMIDAVLDTFALFPRRAVNARPGSAAETHARGLALTVLHDAGHVSPGPLAGVAAGLDWANAQHLPALATAPCDTPLLPPTLFPLLFAALSAAPAAFAVTPEREHPLCAVWRVELAELIAAALTAQHPPVRVLLAKMGARPVYFDDARAFANANTPDTLRQMEKTA
jgi:molybdopterin-guanine dinucleotide biosynthesis protein A